MPTKSLQDSTKIPRFCGVPTYMRLPYTRDLEGVDIAVVGLPFDTASPYRVGCRFGPNAIRQISVLLRPINPYHDVNVFEECSVIDFGDATVMPGQTELSFEHMELCLREVIGAGVIPLCFGGDNSVTYSQMKELHRRHGPISVVHLDAHTDTWGDYFGQRHNAGTAYRRGVEDGFVDVKSSIQIGMRGSLFSRQDIQQSIDLGYEVVTTDQMFEIGIDALASHVRTKLAGRKAFLSIDMDFVDPAYAPGVQIPECGGPSARETIAFLRRLRGLNLVAAEVMEMNPQYDDPGQTSALLAATLGAEILGLMAAYRLDLRR